MSGTRKKLLVALIIGGILCLLAGTLLNTAQVYSRETPDLNAPLLTPVAGSIFVFGAVLLVMAIILGWNNQGSPSSETQPSKEPKSMVFRMPKDQRESGKVTLVVRNGDHHEFNTPPEVMRSLRPGMFGVATILANNLLAFEPDKQQPNLKPKPGDTNVVAEPRKTP